MYLVLIVADIYVGIQATFSKSSHKWYWNSKSGRIKYVPPQFTFQGRICCPALGGANSRFPHKAASPGHMLATKAYSV